MVDFFMEAYRRSTAQIFWFCSGTIIITITYEHKCLEQHPSNMLLLTKSQRGVHVTRETHNRKWPARPPVCHQSFSPLRQFVRIIIQHGATQRPSCFPQGGVPHFCFRICYNFSFLMLLRRSEKKWSLLSSKSEGPRLVKFRSPVSLHWDL